MNGTELVKQENSTDNHVLEDFGYFPETFLVPHRDKIRKGTITNANINKIKF